MLDGYDEEDAPLLLKSLKKNYGKKKKPVIDYSKESLKRLVKARNVFTWMEFGELIVFFSKKLVENETLTYRMALRKLLNAIGLEDKLGNVI